MSCLGFCTFDLEDAGWEDHETAYADIEKIGLSKVVVSSQGKDVVVHTSVLASLTAHPSAMFVMISATG